MWKIQAYEQLQDSILDEGCRDPLVVWDDGRNTLVDGHNRYEICLRNNISYTVVKRGFDSRADAKVWIIQNQFGRRNLTPYERAKLALELEHLFQAKGKKKQREAGGAVCQKSDKAVVDTKRELARIANVSHDTLAKVKVIEEKASAEQKDGLKRGEVSVNRVYKDIRNGEKKQDRKAQIEQLRQEAERSCTGVASGLYDVIVIDPPWDYGTEEEYDPEFFRATTPYPCMGLAEIRALELPAAENCILWLWTTHRFMRDAFDILESWGFDYKCIVTWVKDRFGTGYWLRSQTEFCLLAVKGTPIIDGGWQASVVFGPMREHSRKPDEFYEMVDSLCAGRKLDYFAREQRNGWDVYGNETERFESIKVDFMSN